MKRTLSDQWLVLICVMSCIIRWKHWRRVRVCYWEEKIAGAGNYYPPTVLANVTPEMTAFREEMFGPVAAITIAKDAEHALELANDSEFGLSATIFTTDETQARQMAARLECGGVFINGYCASDARVAFGGVKKSGFGRELSHFGLHEFCNIQTVWKDRV